MCWNCVWGVPKPIADIYNEAVNRLGGNSDALHFGPAHIVWDDFNLDMAQSCLDRFFDGYTYDMTAAELEVVRWSLVELTKLPDEITGYLPEAYIEDIEHPELYPPDIECIKI